MKRAAGIGAIALGLAVTVGACSGDASGGPGTTAAVVTGDGSIPASVPIGFPIPLDATVGSFIVDHATHRTEFWLTVDGKVDALVRFFQIELVNQGYVITSSDGSETDWMMTFADGELMGSIVATVEAVDTVTALVTLNTS